MPLPEYEDHLPSVNTLKSIILDKISVLERKDKQWKEKESQYNLLKQGIDKKLDQLKTAPLQKQNLKSKRSAYKANRMAISRKLDHVLDERYHIHEELLDLREMLAEIEMKRPILQQKYNKIVQMKRVYYNQNNNQMENELTKEEEEYRKMAHNLVYTGPGNKMWFTSRVHRWHDPYEYWWRPG